MRDIILPRLFSSWLLLLVGISVATIEDSVYHNVEILDGNWVDNIPLCGLHHL